MTNDAGVGAEPVATAESEALKQAEAALADAVDVVTSAEAAAFAIAGDLQVARGDFARLDELEELDAEQVLALENRRRRVRRLEGELKQARASVADAELLQAAAAKTADQARLKAIDAELQEMDADFLADAKAARDRLAERRAAIFEKLRLANGIARSLDPNPDMFNWSHRGALAAIGLEAGDALVAAAERLTLEVKRERQRISDEQHAAADARRAALAN